MRHCVIFKRTLVIGLEPGSSRPLLAERAIRGKQQSAQDRTRRAVALISVVAGNVIEIPEEKAAKVDIGPLISADSARTHEA